jgi:predicted DNA-binding transcriptional regulator AlpA
MRSMENLPLLSVEIRGYATGAWPKMIDAEEVERLTGISKEIILEHARAKTCPHVLVSGSIIKFIKSHIVRWLRENLMEVCDGVELSPVPVLVSRPTQFRVPACLAMVADRLVEVGQVSGVYFLVAGDEVVYVGQSLDIACRIAGHRDKKYERVFALPCAPSMLNATEAAFIGLLKPSRNMNAAGTFFVNNDRQAFENPALVLQSMAPGIEGVSK